MSILAKSGFQNTEWRENEAFIDLGVVGEAKRVVIFDSSGNEVTIGSASSSTATLTNKTSSQASQSFLASNTSRKGATIFNDSAAVLYIAYAATATSTAFTYRINPNEQWNMPVLFTGAISGIWEESQGAARITELS